MPAFIKYFNDKLRGHPYTRQEEMQYEGNRIASYKDYPRPANISVTRLAKAGLFYEGHDDSVTCYSCGKTFNNWNKGDDPTERHRRASPECHFVNDCGGNIPMGPCFTSSSGEGRSTVSESLSLSIPASQENENFQTTSSNTQIISGETNSSTGGHVPIDFSRMDLQNPNDRLREAGMKSEYNRLGTYSTWPASNHVQPSDLARAGFYYSGVDDRVQCVFCHGILRNWEHSDVPQVEHATHFPHCPFILNLNVGNTTIAELSNMTVQNTASQGLGIITDTARHPQYAIQAARVQTYDGWPIPHLQAPQRLAAAGFFYAGFSDNAKCFFCDGGLRNWDKDDDPWIEHAKWFSRCGYLRQSKGLEYIQRVREQFPGAGGGNQTGSSEQDPLFLTITGPTSNEGSSTNTNTRSLDNGSSHTVQPREIKARLDTAQVQAVLDMGYSRSLVRAAIERRLRTTGDDFPSVESLLEAVFETEDQLNTPAIVNTPISGATSNPQAPSADTGCSSKNDISSTGNRSKGTTNMKRSAATQSKTMEVTEEATKGNSTKATVDEVEEEEKLLKENQELKEARTCKVCLDNEINIVFLPCGHLVCCSTCAPALRHCPICRSLIRGTVRTFLS